MGKSKVLITGGTGYIGGRFISYLLASGTEETEIYVLARRECTEWRQYPVQVIRGDLVELEPDQFKNQNFDVVIHFAALMADRDDLPEETFHQANVVGTRNLIESLRGCHVRQFIYTSTVGVYGPTSTEPVREEIRTGSNLSIYESTKLEGEMVCRELCDQYEMPWTILRLGLIYGEGMTYGWPHVVDSTRKGEMHVIGDGVAMIQLSYITDIIDGIALTIGNPEAVGEVINLSGADACAISQVFNTIADILGVKHPKKIPFAPLYILSHGASHLPTVLKTEKLKLLTPHRVRFFKENHVYSIAKARKILRFTPKYTIKTGMETMIATLLNEN